MWKKARVPKKEFPNQLKEVSSSELQDLVKWEGRRGCTGIHISAVQLYPQNNLWQVGKNDSLGEGESCWRVHLGLNLFMQFERRNRWLIHVVTALISKELKAIQTLLMRLLMQRQNYVLLWHEQLISWGEYQLRATCKQNLIALFVQTTRISTGWIWHTTHPWKHTQTHTQAHIWFH